MRTRRLRWVSAPKVGRPFVVQLLTTSLRGVRVCVCECVRVSSKLMTSLVELCALTAHSLLVKLRTACLPLRQLPSRMLPCFRLLMGQDGELPLLSEIGSICQPQNGKRFGIYQLLINGSRSTAQVRTNQV